MRYPGPCPPFVFCSFCLSGAPTLLFVHCVLTYRNKKTTKGQREKKKKNATNVTNRTQPTQRNRSVRCALYVTISTQRTQRMQHNVTGVLVAMCTQRSEGNATNATSGYKPPRMVLTPLWHVSQAANPVACLKNRVFGQNGCFACRTL